MNTKFETGATHHAVNDLILFVDNTRECAQLRDDIYRSVLQVKPGTMGSRRVNWNLLDKSIFDNGGAYGWHFNIVTTVDRLAWMFAKYLPEFQKAYIKELPTDNEHIIGMNREEKNEFVNLYIDGFEDWKKEHS
jgi:hypothetical protein